MTPRYFIHTFYWIFLIPCANKYMDRNCTLSELESFHYTVPFFITHPACKDTYILKGALWQKFTLWQNITDAPKKERRHFTCLCLWCVLCAQRWEYIVVYVGTLIKSIQAMHGNMSYRDHTHMIHELSHKHFHHFRRSFLIYTRRTYTQKKLVQK